MRDANGSVSISGMATAPVQIASGATFTYRVVEHPSGAVIVSAGDSTVARFVPNADGTVAFVDLAEPLLNDPHLEGSAMELATAYAEHLAESDDLRHAF